MNYTDKLVEIFVACDDFYKEFDKMLFRKGLHESATVEKQHTSSCSMSPSEIMAIVIFYHLSGFKCFKYFYCQGILGSWKSYFPQALSYNRFIEVRKEVSLALFAFILYARQTSHYTDTYYIDSSKLAVCDPHRIHNHKVFKEIAQRGKTSMGWFFGLKLHLLINEKGELISFCFTPGNVSDNTIDVVCQLCAQLHAGKVYGDAGYISKKLFEHLYQKGVTLITKVRKNMKNKLMSLQDKYLLKKRAIVETVIDLLKNFLDLWHTRHRSMENAFNNALACLVAYTFLDKKPSISSFNKRNLVLDLLKLSN